MRRRLATAIGRFSNGASRLLGRGGGTAIGGLLATRVFPNYAVDALRELDSLVLVTGTNGKTTTTALLAAALQAAGRRVVTNSTGSNLERGLASTVLKHAGWDGRLRAASRSTGVFELDEWAFVSLAERLRPSVIVLLNLFRDQLDRYGEVERTASEWRRVLAGISPTIVAANADDPTIVSVAQEHAGKKAYFGVDAASARSQPEEWADARRCSICETPLSYDSIAYAHLGAYCCPRGHVRRPPPSLRVTKVLTEGLRGSHVTMQANGESVTVDTALPGVYNAYNLAAAVAAAAELGVEWRSAAETVARHGPAFGRAEAIPAHDREIILLLVKNPAGANQTLEILASEPKPRDTLLLLNDGIADGRDVSWIWDVEFERLRSSRITVGGRRAKDLALRLKYAGVRPANGELRVIPGIAAPLDAALAASDGPLAVLATYTAMLEVRAECARRGWAAPYWREAP